MSTYVILLGPPGAGKGTQAATIADHTKLLHLATGDMFRENVRNQTELGQAGAALHGARRTRPR